MQNLSLYLSKFSEADSLAAVEELPRIPEVDRNAVQILDWVP